MRLLHDEIISLDEIGQIVLWWVENALNNFPHDIKDSIDIIYPFFGIDNGSIDMHELKNVLSIWDHFIKGSALWECTWNKWSTAISLKIKIRNSLSKKQFIDTVIHETTHAVFLLLKRLQNWMDYADSSEFSMVQNEMLIRVHTANHTMLYHDKWRDRDDTWNNTGKAKSNDWYALSQQYATRIISSRNRIYNLLAQKYWIDHRQSINVNIQQPWYNKFVTFVDAYNTYLFMCNDHKSLSTIIDTIETASKQKSIENTITYLTNNNHVTYYWNERDLINFLNNIRYCY